MPVAAFLLGAGIEYSDIKLGHALFNKNIKRGVNYISSSSNKKENQAMFRCAIIEGVKDFKTAAATSVFRIIADQGMHYSGGYEKLENIKNNLKQKNPELYEALSVYSKVMSYGVRPLVQPILGDRIFGHDTHHVNLAYHNHYKYRNQPNCPN